MQVDSEGRTRRHGACADVLFLVKVVAAAFVKVGNRTVDGVQVR